MKEATLEPAELCFLLEMAHARTAPGLDEPVAPESPGQRSGFLELGFSGLLEKGWFSRTADGKVRHDAGLVLAATTVAEASFSVLLTRTLAGMPARKCAYYFAGKQVVELVPTRDGKYCLTNLLDAQTVANRVARTLQVPAKGEPASGILPEKRFATLRDALREGRPVQMGEGFGGSGLSPRAAELCEAAIRSPQVIGSVLMTRWRVVDLPKEKKVEVFVGKDSGCAVWLPDATPGSVEIETAIEEPFAGRLGVEIVRMVRRAP